jgi:uncharacterized protein (DUF2235 family)
MAKTPTNDLSADGGPRYRPPRHLIVLLDGTGVTASNVKPGSRHSNIYKLNLALTSHNDALEAQVAFYIPGIGASIAPSWIDPFHLKQALGYGLLGDVEQAYINICSNYFPGDDNSPRDRIYLFGFSRGAVVARLVASLISKFGLLRADRLGRFGDLWKAFMNADEAANLGTLLTKGVHRNVTIDFLGVFDTVMGTYGGSYASALKEHFFGNTLLPLRVTRALHLLALNETRADFACVPWTGLEPGERAPSRSKTVLEQIWMPGVHTDVGGGYREDFLSKVALLTMLDRVTEETDLKIQPTYRRDLERKISEILRDAATPRITIHKETQLIWTMKETVIDGWRVPKPKTESFEWLHPICRLMSDMPIKRRGSNQFEKYTFPSCPLQEASSFSFIKTLISQTEDADHTPATP